MCIYVIYDKFIHFFLFTHFLFESQNDSTQQFKLGLINIRNYKTLIKLTITKL